MKNSSLLGALAGSLLVTAVHETLRHLTREAPRMDLMGEDAVEKGAEAAGITPPRGKALYGVSLAMDVISNAIYYSLAGTLRRKKGGWLLGPALGLLAGVGGITLPKPLGLNPDHSAKTPVRAGMTVGYYLLGGLAAVLVMDLLDDKDA